MDDETPTKITIMLMEEADTEYASPLRARRGRTNRETCCPLISLRRWQILGAPRAEW